MAQVMRTFFQTGVHAALVILALSLGACTPDAASDASSSSHASTAQHTYGTAVQGAQAVLARAVSAEPLAYTGTRLTVEGRVSSVCQKKGCWLALDTGTGPPIRVTVPRTNTGDYVFTVPTDLSGWATVSGLLRQVTLDAATQQHLADDGAATSSSTELHLAAAGITVRPLATGR